MQAKLIPCPACGRPHDPTLIPPPRVPIDIPCACCCQDGDGRPWVPVTVGSDGALWSIGDILAREG